MFHLGGWMAVHSLQDVDQIGVGMNALHPAGHQQAPDDADMFSTQLLAGPFSSTLLRARAEHVADPL